jgi:tetratricopeptide (TPR) repeat protein
MSQSRNQACACGSGKKYKQCCGASNKAVGLNHQALAEGLRTAWVNFEAGRLDYAAEICQKILHSLRGQIDALYLLGLIALKDGQIERAIEYLGDVVKQNATRAPFIASLGFAYHEQGQLDLAIKAYQQAIKLDPACVDAYYNLHAALIKSEKPSDLTHSISALNQVIQLSPNDQDALLMLGLLCDYQGDAASAKECFNQLQNAAPVIKARLDAWHYIKEQAKPLPPITGSILDTFKIAIEAAKNEGLVLEFGVRHGNSIRQLATLSNQAVHGFDSFEGLPEAWHDEGKGSYSTKGVIPKVPVNVTLHKGWFDETLPQFLAKNDEPIRLINIDCDIYSSTKTILDLLAPRIHKGTVIIFDEYIGNQHWREDEFKAFQEAVKANHWQYEYLAFSFFTKQVVVKIV